MSHLPLSATVRSELDGFALGRTRRIIEAPDLLAHAAADAESWPFVETAVQKTLALARSRGVQLDPAGYVQRRRVTDVVGAGLEGRAEHRDVPSDPFGTQ